MSINYQENIIYQIYPLGACDAFNNEGISIIFNGVCIKEKHDFGGGSILPPHSIYYWKTEK